jgi:DNA helicase HerA-like ATPase
MFGFIKKCVTKLLDPASEFPVELANPFIDYMLERSYLEEISSSSNFVVPEMTGREVWFKIDRLPIHPSVLEDYDLLARWQSVLASLHAWNDKLLFLLQRSRGQTNIYIGINSTGNRQESESRCWTALKNCMPGIEIDSLKPDEIDEVRNKLYDATDVGAVTGIPSFRKDTQYSVLQTLDQLAFGVRDIDGEDANFSLLVVAEPMNDGLISDTIARFQQLGSDIHKDVTHTTNESRGFNVGIGALLVTLSNMVIPGSGFVASSILGVLGGTGVLGGGGGGNEGGGGTRGGGGGGFSYNRNKSASTEHLNKFAQYSEKVTDMHCARLRNGRNLGFWNVGIYVLGKMERNVTTVLGMLRSIYSGDESYIEPIRIHRFAPGNPVSEIIKSRSLIPLTNPNPSPEIKDVLRSSGIAADDWHIFGKPYQYLSTPLNTQELSLVTSLPRKDVPGLRFVKTAVRFANNSGEADDKNSLVIGKIKDTGVIQKNNNYRIGIDALVRHSLIVGGTGCGKTTTCKTIINSVLDRNIPVLIIEPAKDEYIRWAIERKKQGKDINIFMPGVKTFEGERIPQLKLNPFQPAAIKGAEIDMMTRCEQFTSLLCSSLPASDVLPVLIDETIFTYLKEQPFGDDFLQGEMKQQGQYPKLEGVLPTAQKLLKSRGYSEEVSNGLSAALETRFSYLTRGKRGEILNVINSTPCEDIFMKTTVINLSKIANPRDRALIMSILMLTLYEYRVSAYAYNADYRKRAQENKLLHLTVVEEAHNVLSKPGSDTQGTGNPQQVVADLFSNMLSEIRAYGEGLMIVDQVPTKLIPDVIKNTNYKIVHRMTSADDCAVMESALALRKDQEGIIPTLSQGDIIVSGDKDDAASWVKVNKPV